MGFKFNPLTGNLDLVGAGSNFITSASDTNSIDITVAAEDISADLIIGTPSPPAGSIKVDLAVDASGLVADVIVNDLADAFPISDTNTTGLLTDTDWDTFNNKIDSTEKGASNGVATLDGGGKIPAAQLPNSVMEFKGTWDANTNSPVLIDGTGNAGDVYRVSVAGTQNLGSGAFTYAIGDWVMYNGTIWQKSPATDAVTSVNGFMGAVTLDANDVDAANKNLSNLDSPTEINQDLIPDGTATRKLGSPTDHWIEVYTPLITGVEQAITISTQGSAGVDGTGRAISILSDATGLAPSATGAPINITTGISDAAPSGAINIRTGAPINGGTPGGINIESGGPQNSIVVTANAVGLNAGDGANLIFIQGSSIDFYGEASVSTVETKYYNLEQDFSFGIKAPDALANDYTLTLPLDVGSLNQVLTTDGSGETSWQTVKSPGDITETSFAGANNQIVAADVTGFAFSNGTVRGFEALATVFLDATTPAYEIFTLRGIQKASTWSLNYDSTGDDSNIVFNITNAGQITYTSPNSAGFVSLTIKFRANTLSV